jgi:hypothetical protein
VIRRYMTFCDLWFVICDLCRLAKGAMLSNLSKKSQISVTFYKFPIKTGYKNVTCDLCFAICVFSYAPVTVTNQSEPFTVW